MKKIILIITILLFTNSQAFIFTLTIFKKYNAELNQFNYVINSGDLHSADELNIDQILAIGKLINDLKDNGLFLFEGGINLEKLQFRVKEIAKMYKFAVPYSPLGLENYVKSKGRIAKNIETRLGIPNDFKDFLQDFFKKDRELTCPMKDLAHLILEPLKFLEQDIQEIEKLKDNLAISEECKIYLEFFEKFKLSFQKDQKFANKLNNIDADFMDYMIQKYVKKKGIHLDIFKNELESLILNKNAGDMKSCTSILLDFSKYLGKKFWHKITGASINVIELNAFKEIILGKNFKKIFIFVGNKHAENLNEMLVAANYQKVFEISSNLKNVNINEELKRKVSKLHNELINKQISIEECVAISKHLIAGNSEDIKPIDANLFLKLSEENLDEITLNI